MRASHCMLIGTRCCFSLLFICVQPELDRLLAHHLRTIPHGAELCSRTRLLWLAVVSLALNAKRLLPDKLLRVGELARADSWCRYTPQLYPAFVDRRREEGDIIVCSGPTSSWTDAPRSTGSAAAWLHGRLQRKVLPFCHLFRFSLLFLSSFISIFRHLSPLSSWPSAYRKLLLDCSQQLTSRQSDNRPRT